MGVVGVGLLFSCCRSGRCCRFALLSSLEMLSPFRVVATSWCCSISIPASSFNLALLARYSAHFASIGPSRAVLYSYIGVYVCICVFVPQEPPRGLLGRRGLLQSQHSRLLARAMPLRYSLDTKASAYFDDDICRGLLLLLGDPQVRLPGFNNVPLNGVLFKNA